MSPEQNNDTRNVFAGCLGGLVMLVIAGLLLALVAKFALDPWHDWQTDACQRRWPEKQIQWEWWNGCILQTEEGWVPEKNYRVLD